MRNLLVLVVLWMSGFMLAVSLVLLLTPMNLVCLDIQHGIKQRKVEQQEGNAGHGLPKATDVTDDEEYVVELDVDELLREVLGADTLLVLVLVGIEVLGDTRVLQALLKDNEFLDLFMQHILAKVVLRVQVVEEAALRLEDLPEQPRRKNTNLRLRHVEDDALVVGLGVVFARLQVTEVVLIVEDGRG